MTTVEDFINTRLVSTGYSVTVDEIAYNYRPSEIVLGTTVKCDVFDQAYNLGNIPVKWWHSFSLGGYKQVPYLKNFKNPLYLYLDRDGKEFFLEKKVYNLFPEQQHYSAAAWLGIALRDINHKKVQITL
jgi:hypothetical protein